MRRFMKPTTVWRVIPTCPSLPQEQRIKDYIRQVKNPYCYLDNGVVVHISFADTDATLEDQLLSYLKRMT